MQSVVFFKKITIFAIKSGFCGAFECGFAKKLYELELVINFPFYCLREVQTASTSLSFNSYSAKCRHIF